MYNLQLEKAIDSIEKQGAKTVLVQLPDGLKPRAKDIQEQLSETGAEIMLWGGSCFGACDLPSLHNVKVDLMIQFGHSRWKDV